MASSGEVNSNDLIAVDMFLCYADSLYCKCPDALGCYGNSTCLCLESTFKCCKPHSSPEKICILNANDCNCIYPTVCCKQTSQVCCLDVRCALPCDADVPCGFGCCGLILCFNYQLKPGCCVTFANLRGEKVYTAEA